METSTEVLVLVGALFVVAGVVALAGLLVSDRIGTDAGHRRGRVAALVASGAVGVLAGLTGALFQGYTVRIGGSSTGPAAGSDGAAALAAADAGTGPAHAAGGTVGGFAFPLGALLMLAVLAAVLWAAARRLRAPIGVAVPAAAWLIVVSVLMYGGNGDVILAATAQAQIYFLGGLILAVGFFIPAYQWQLNDRFGANAMPRAAAAKPVAQAKPVRDAKPVKDARSGPDAKRK